MSLVDEVDYQFTNESFGIDSSKNSPTMKNQAYNEIILETTSPNNYTGNQKKMVGTLDKLGFGQPQNQFITETVVEEYVETSNSGGKDQKKLGALSKMGFGRPQNQVI